MKPSYWRRRRPLLEPGAERRESVRHVITLDTSCRILAMVQGDPIPVRVRNISAGGISLVINHAVDSGSILDIELLNRPQMFLCKLQVLITYAVEHPTGDWILGGSFVKKLDEEEVKRLLT